MKEVPLGSALRSGVAEQSLHICTKALLLHDREQGAIESEVIVFSHNRNCTGLPVQTQRLHPNILWPLQACTPFSSTRSRHRTQPNIAFYGKFNIFVKGEK